MNDVNTLLEKAKKDSDSWNFLLARILELVGKKDKIAELKNALR